MSGNTEETLEVLREMWGAQGQSAEDLEEACGTTKSCKRMTDVGFDGLAEETGGDLRRPGGPAGPRGQAETPARAASATWSSGSERSEPDGVARPPSAS